MDTFGYNPDEILDPVTGQKMGLEPIPVGLDDFETPPENKPKDVSAPKKWKDHIGQDYYTKLTSDEQEDFRRQYFEYRVAPQIPENDLFSARMQFDVYSAQDVFGSNQGRLSSAGGSIARGFGKIVASLPKAVAEGAVNLANKFGDDPIWGNPDRVTPEQTTAYKAGEAIEGWFNTFSVNPAYRDEFVTSKLASGFGSLGGFVAGGFAGKIAKIPVLVTTMGLGAAATGVEGVEDYLSTLSKDEKADPEIRESAFNLNAALGTSEALPVLQILDRLDKASGGGVKRILKEGFKGGLEELTQEVLQSVGQNAIAAKLLKYDPERSLLSGTQEAGEVGFTLGFALNTLAAMIGSRRAGNIGVPPQQDAEFTEEPPIDVAPSETAGPALEGELLGPEALPAPEGGDLVIGQTGGDGHITQIYEALPAPEQKALPAPDVIEGRSTREVGIETLSAPQEDSRSQVSISPISEKRKEDRRRNKDLRKKVEEMSPEERFDAIYMDRLSGLLNRRAMEDLPSRSHTVSTDLDSLKWYNDEMSPETGDQALEATGKAIASVIGDSATVTGFRQGGDEFYVTADTKEEAESIMKEIEEVLSKESLVHEKKGITKQGISLTWGIGVDKESADQAMKDAKVAKEKAGTRASRGEEPAGITRTSTILEVDSSGTQPSALEGSADSSTIGTKNLSDLVETESFKTKGFSGLDVVTQGLVMDSVFMSVSDLKVANSIVSLIPVDVVDNLGGKQAAANMLLHDKPMFKSAITTDSGAYISGITNVSDSLIAGITPGTTEIISIPSDVVSKGIETGTTEGTIDDRHIPTTPSDVTEAGAASTASALLSLTQESLQSKKVPEIRTIQRELGIPPKGKKSDAIQSILDETGRVKALETSKKKSKAAKKREKVKSTDNMETAIIKLGGLSWVEGQVQAIDRNNSIPGIGPLVRSEESNEGDTMDGLSRRLQDAGFTVDTDQLTDWFRTGEISSQYTSEGLDAQMEQEALDREQDIRDQAAEDGESQEITDLAILVDRVVTVLGEESLGRITTLSHENAETEEDVENNFRRIAYEELAKQETGEGKAATGKGKKAPDLGGETDQADLDRYAAEQEAERRRREAASFDLERTDVPITESVDQGDIFDDWAAYEQKSKQEVSDAIARDRDADTTADALNKIDETGCPR